MAAAKCSPAPISVAEQQSAYWALLTIFGLLGVALLGLMSLR